MEKNNLKIWIWSAIALVIIVAIILIVVFTNKQTVNTVQPVNTTTQDNTVTKEPDSVQDISTQDKGVSAVSISYSKALVTYATRRIQLDATCQAIPNNVTYKDNTGIMIDNRSPNTRTIKVGTTFTIKPWGFKIVVLPDIYLKSKTLLIDCDSRQNVATVLIQE